MLANYPKLNNALIIEFLGNLKRGHFCLYKWKNLFLTEKIGDTECLPS